MNREARGLAATKKKQTHLPQRPPCEQVSSESSHRFKDRFLERYIEGLEKEIVENRRQFGKKEMVTIRGGW